MRNATVLPHTITQRWGSPHRSYIAAPGAQAPSWLFLSELHEVIGHAGFRPESLDPEWQFLLATMEQAEKMFGRRTRLVFYFDW